MIQVCYISAVNTITDKKMSWIEEAIANAIQKTIVDPFQDWCHDIWIGFVNISLPACVMISLVAVMLSLLGVKKAQKWVLIPIVIYLFIQIFNFLI